MQHEWMGKYRNFVESIIFLCNCSSTGFVIPYHYGTDIKITARETQILEYLLENRTEIMSEVAKRLGVTRGAFSNTVSKLVEKGCIEKIHPKGNKKNYYLAVTYKGLEVYQKYSRFIYNYWFREMFKLADEIPEEYIDKFSQILNRMGHSIETFEGVREHEVFSNNLRDEND